MSKEARLFSITLIIAALFCTGASYRTENFIVTADTPQLAQEIGDKAESDRRQLAIEWLGEELPPWSDICPITAQVGPHLGAGGATSFMFSHNRPFGWTMSIQGSRERVLDSVLPHEVTHTIFATHFGRPLPRWADEGACTTVEHDSEKLKQQRLLIQFLTTSRGIAFNRMFAMTEYPPDVLPLYSQGYSLARYLIAQGGKRRFVDYVGEGMQTNNWPAVTKKYYSFDDLSDLQVTWLDWVRQGSPRIDGPQNSQDSNILLASNEQRQQPANRAEPLATRNIESSVNENANGGSSSFQNAVAVVTVPNRPSNDQLATTVTRRSWYLEQRDMARDVGPVSDATLSPPTGVYGKDGDYSPGSIRDTIRTPTTLTRPQPVGYPKQQILQMNNLRNAAPSSRLQVTPTSFQSQPYNFNTTILPRSTGSS